MKLMPTLRAAAFAGSIFVAQHASAQLTVFDPANFAQNVVTAAKAVSGEIYQNTNILYQYQMMVNQLLQAQNLNPAAWKAAYDQITGDINKVKGLVGTLQGLYGDLKKGGEWVTQVQGLISRSGKSNAQWFLDMNTLFQQNDKVARNLFQMGSNIMQHTNEMAQRRQELQSQLSLSPTQQATAEITTHYLDIVTSQNADILQLNAAKAQKEAQKDAQQAEEDKEKSGDAEKFISKQQAERAAYGITQQ
ncbi:type VI secretion protein [Burkholderia sp. 4701]|nr:type VI secretion protein [Burkholderia sp. 4701]MXN83550.1 type VI secretion protein [Burkholderia sp. 4812]